MLIFVRAAAGRRVYLRDLKGPIPEGGFWVHRTDEVDKYISEGMLFEGKKETPKKERPKKPPKGGIEK